tara:strand:- start:41232 stop:41357 length:126 start_codon:yes stop_codon:yes gene_type:complete
VGSTETRFREENSEIADELKITLAQSRIKKLDAGITRLSGA